MGAIPSNLHAQQVSSEALPDAPGARDAATGLPVAVEMPSPAESAELPASIVSDTQSRKGAVYTLDGHVSLHYRNYTLTADHVEYNQDTQEVTASGHLVLTGGEEDAFLSASHGTLNFADETGTFYDVNGSVGVRNSGSAVIYTSGNPFLFGGERVVKTGPKTYHVYRGWVTSCQLPNPDWKLYSGQIAVDGERARMSNSVFSVKRMPVLYLPYVTHPVDPNARESGLWTPVVGQSNTKGIVLGEQFYLVLGRSADLTVGLQYYSLRGWEESASLRFVGRGARGEDFARLRYSGLVDRGIVQANGGYTNQGGEDVSFSGRHDFSESTRAVADAEYLSSYVYREAFSESFNQAVSSDVSSVAFLTHQWNGFSADLRADRYQGLKRVPVPATPTRAGRDGEQVHILHVPSLDFTAVDQRLGSSQFVWNVEGSAAGLKRVQPNFVTGGVVERYDFHPQLGYVFGSGGWRFMPTFALRDTFYSRSRVTPFVLGGTPKQSPDSLNRADLEMEVELRAPVVERTFRTPLLKRFLGTELRHTIEPALVYRNVRGVDNFLGVLRFDDIDVVSNTDEVQYGVTQHLYARGGDRGRCAAERAAGSADAADGGDETARALPDLNEDAGFGMDPEAPTRTGRAARPLCQEAQKEWFSWRLTQKYFFDPKFGGAVIMRRRNIFDTTLRCRGLRF